MYITSVPWYPLLPSSDRISGPSPHTTKYSKIRDEDDDAINGDIRARLSGGGGDRMSGGIWGSPLLPLYSSSSSATICILIGDINTDAISYRARRRRRRRKRRGWWWWWWSGSTVRSDIGRGEEYSRRDEGPPTARASEMGWL